MSWKVVGHQPGGTVAGLATVHGKDGTLLLAATPVGVFSAPAKSRRWAATSAKQNVPMATSVTADADRDSRKGTLFSTGKGGVYRSRDQGRTWHLALRSPAVSAVVAGPASLVLAASAEDGIQRSVDGGDTWAAANAGLLDFCVLALALSTGFASDHIAFAGTSSGLYVTRNRGNSWRALDMGRNETSVQAIAVSATFADDHTLFVGTEADGLFRSADAGETWGNIDAIGGSVTALAAGRLHGSSAVAVAAFDQVLVSIAGTEWRPAERLPAPVLALSFLPEADDQILLAGVAGAGVFTLAGEGMRWTSAADGLQAALCTSLHVSPNFRSDHTLLSLSPEGFFGLSRDAGATWAIGAVVPGGAAIDLRVSSQFAADRTVWLLASDGLYRSRDCGAAWHSLAGPAGRGRASAIAAGLSASATPFLLAGFTDGHLCASDDGGETWRHIARCPGGQVVGLCVRPGLPAEREMLVVTTSGDAPGEMRQLWRYTGKSAAWECLLDAEQAPTLLNAVLADGSVLAALDRRVMILTAPFAEWQVAELGGDVTAITELVVVEGTCTPTVFACTDAGIFQSDDRARTFSLISDGPPATTALAVSPTFAQDGLLFAVAPGGAVWCGRVST